MAEVVNMPKLGFDMAEGVLVRWVASEGDSIERGQIIAEIETDKATVEVESLASGVMHRHLIVEGTATPVGAPIAVIADPGEDVDVEALIGAVKEEPSPTVDKKPIEKRETIETTIEVTAQEGDGRLPGGVRASPLARRMAEQHGIDLANLTGSGSAGRIVKRDVESFMQSSGHPISGPALPPSLPPTGETVRIPLSKIRSAIGRRMATAKQELPHFYLTVDIDADPMMAMRAEWNELHPDEEKLSVNDFIVKAAALALREFPNLNASLHENEIVRHGEVNIGVAVAVDEGLLTAVVRNADVKSVPFISNEVRAMVARIREGKVRPQDVEGSTFTVSNLGMFGVDRFIAIINPPEAAILAVGSVRKIPVVKDGGILPGSRVQCTLSADHRVTDGAEAARWLQVFRKNLEHPLLLMISE